MNFAKIFAENRYNIITKKDRNEFKKITSQIKTLETTDLININWVWEATVKKLLEKWINSEAELLEYKIEDIEKLKLNILSMKAIRKLFDNKK